MVFLLFLYRFTLIWNKFRFAVTWTPRRPLIKRGRFSCLDFFVNGLAFFSLIRIVEILAIRNLAIIFQFFIRIYLVVQGSRLFQIILYISLVVWLSIFWDLCVWCDLFWLIYNSCSLILLNKSFSSLHKEFYIFIIFFLRHKKVMIYHFQEIKLEFIKICCRYIYSFWKFIVIKESFSFLIEVAGLFIKFDS